MTSILKCRHVTGIENYLFTRVFQCCREFQPESSFFFPEQFLLKLKHAKNRANSGKAFRVVDHFKSYAFLTCNYLKYYWCKHSHTFDEYSQIVRCWFAPSRLVLQTSFENRRNFNVLIANVCGISAEMCVS